VRTSRQPSPVKTNLIMWNISTTLIAWQQMMQYMIRIPWFPRQKQILHHQMGLKCKELSVMMKLGHFIM